MDSLISKLEDSAVFKLLFMGVIIALLANLLSHTTNVVMLLIVNTTLNIFVVLAVQDIITLLRVSSSEPDITQPSEYK